MADTSRRTIDHYEKNAERFWNATRDHDVTQNIDALLASIEGGAPPYRILDFGCGPGRDLVSFKARGHEPVGLDGCASFVAMAKEQSGCEVLHQDFLALDLPERSFDGVFANASLFHVPSEHLPRVARELLRATRPGGALVCSNPIGENSEGWDGDRYGCFFDRDKWLRIFLEAGFELLGHYVRADRWIVFRLRVPVELRE